MKYNKVQILQIIAAAIFLVGAIFMLIQTFTDEQWAFYVGLSLALVAGSLYVWILVENRRTMNKKLTYSDNEPNTNSYEKDHHEIEVEKKN